MTREAELAARLDDILRRMDEPKLANPKYAMDRRVIEGELRAVAREAVSDSDKDAALGRRFRAALDGLSPDWRLGFVRTDTGWRSVLLPPESGQPVAFVDASTIDDLFADQGDAK